MSIAWAHSYFINAMNTFSHLYQCYQHHSWGKITPSLNCHLLMQGGIGNLQVRKEGKGGECGTICEGHVENWARRACEGVCKTRPGALPMQSTGKPTSLFNAKGTRIVIISSPIKKPICLSNLGCLSPNGCKDRQHRDFCVDRHLFAMLIATVYHQWQSMASKG